MEAENTYFKKRTSQFIFFLGSAWLLVEISIFIIDRFDLDQVLGDIAILCILFGLSAAIITTLFKGRFNIKAVVLQVLNLIAALSVVFYFLSHPLSMNPGNLRLVKLYTEKPSDLSSLTSLAVLPFNNYMGDDSNNYLLAGMHDGLISELGQLGGLRVVSRTSTRSFKNTDKNVQQIAAELRVDAIIETSLIRIDTIIELRLKLINALPEESILWDESFQVPMNQLPNLFRETTKNVAEAIKGVILPASEEQLTSKRAPNPGAYEAFLRGSYYTGFLTHEGFELAKKQFGRAIEIDSSFAPAYSGLYMILVSQRQMGYVSGENTVTMLDSLANKAYQLDSTDAAILLMKAVHLTWTKFDWDEAEKKFKESIALNPSNAPGRSTYAHYLMIQNRWDEAWVQMNMALELDPENPWVLAFSMPMYGNDGKILSAAKNAERLLQIAPNHPMADMILLYKYVALNKDKEAVKQLIEVCKNYGVDQAEQIILGGYSDGKFETALKSLLPYLEEYTKDHTFSTFRMFEFYGMIDDKEMQDKWLMKMYEESNPSLPYLGIKKVKFDSDVRATIMKEIGLWN